MGEFSMDDAHYHEIQQWLLKSRRDLEAARVLFEHGLFEILRDSAEVLTPYATEFRYPDDTIEPEKYEAEEALAIASLVLDFVVKLLPNS
jgi:HEPN domain-containing protein